MNFAEPPLMRIEKKTPEWLLRRSLNIWKGQELIVLHTSDFLLEIICTNSSSGIWFLGVPNYA
jgi:hypothetical protein